MSEVHRNDAERVPKVPKEDVEISLECCRTGP